MKIQDVWNALEQIRRESGDPETAHGLEDALWAAVLESIASGNAEHPQQMAEMALRSRDISFARWCA